MSASLGLRPVVPSQVRLILPLIDPPSRGAWLARRAPRAEERGACTIEPRRAHAHRARLRGARPRFDKIRLIVREVRLFVRRRSSTLRSNTFRDGPRGFRREPGSSVFGEATFPLGKSRIRHGFRAFVFRLRRLVVERERFRLLRPRSAGRPGPSLVEMEPSQTGHQGFSAVYEGSSPDNEASAPEREVARAVTQSSRLEKEAPRPSKEGSRATAEALAAIRGGVRAVTEGWSLKRDAPFVVAQGVGPATQGLPPVTEAHAGAREALFSSTRPPHQRFVPLYEASMAGFFSRPPWSSDL